MRMMRRYMVDDDGIIVLIQRAEYDFDRYLMWVAMIPDWQEFIVIDGTVNTLDFDNRKLGR